MLNEERIRIMANMSMYEEGKGKQEFRINRYFKRDYVGLNMIYTFIWVTIGYMIILGMYGVTHFGELLDGLNDLEGLKQLGIRFVIGYVIILVFYLIVLWIFYTRTHKRASANVREYYAQLRRLEKQYAIEDGLIVEDEEEDDIAPKKKRGGRH